MDLRDFLQEILPAGIGIYEAHIRPAGKGWHFEIVLDGLNHRTGAVSVDDCARCSRYFSEKLDSEIQSGRLSGSWPGVFPDGLNTENYSVQVSSAGAERVLRIPEDLERFRGLPLRLKIRAEGSVQSVFALFEGEENSAFVFTEYIPYKHRKKRPGGLFTQPDGRMSILKENLIQVNLYLDL